MCILFLCRVVNYALHVGLGLWILFNTSQFCFISFHPVSFSSTSIMLLEQIFCESWFLSTALVFSLLNDFMFNLTLVLACGFLLRIIYSRSLHRTRQRSIPIRYVDASTFYILLINILHKSKSETPYLYSDQKLLPNYN